MNGSGGLVLSGVDHDAQKAFDVLVGAHPEQKSSPDRWVLEAGEPASRAFFQFHGGAAGDSKSDFFQKCPVSSGEAPRGLGASGGPPVPSGTVGAP